MNKIDRYKILMRYVVNAKIAPSQKAFGVLMGYTNESSFSQILNGKVREPKDFRNKLSSNIPGLNEAWIETGEGEMIKSASQQTLNGDHNTQIAGNNNSINLPNTLDKAIDEIAEQRKLVAKAQEQIDRLITIIERK